MRRGRDATRQYCIETYALHSLQQRHLLGGQHQTHIHTLQTAESKIKGGRADTEGETEDLSQPPNGPSQQTATRCYHDLLPQKHIPDYQVRW
jgi:hypothetical protein